MMKKLLLFPVCILTFAVHAQNAPQVQGEEPFGKVGMDEMTMTSCDFEKNANAEILFNKAVVKANPHQEIDVHERIKVFTDRGTGKGDFTFTVPDDGFGNPISDIEAKTFNLENGKIVVSTMDPKAVYFTTVDRWRKKIAFAVPNVKPGSVIDLQYKTRVIFDTWFFQADIPTRYSELEADYLGRANIRTIPHVRQSFAVDSKQGDDGKEIRIMTNVHSLPDEVYMTSQTDNLERVEFMNADMLGHSWNKIAEVLSMLSEFGGELDQSLSGEGDIIKKSKALPSIDAKIAFIFDTVRNTMKWDEVTAFLTSGPVNQSWNKKSGNSADINLVLYNLLKRGGINAFPMVMSTRKKGKMSPVAPNPYAFDKVVVYVPVDSTKYYVLDASDKYNLYNTTPFDNLNTFGEGINPKTEKAFNIQIENTGAVIQSAFINAEITADGKISGTDEITSDQYNKIAATRKYQSIGEQKYLDSLQIQNKNLKITSLKVENLLVDSLPLSQKLAFKGDLPGSDENYIYFNPSVLSGIPDNPFQNENRYSDIDLGYRDDYSISEMFKIPAGYKVDALPKSMTIVMPDQSILFKRTIAQNEDTIVVRYLIDHRKTVFFAQDYQDLRGFYKKMYELLNEQVVLKKG